MPRKLVAGNWKMHGTLESAGALASMTAQLVRNDAEPAASPGPEILLCPPYVHIPAVSKALEDSESAIDLGAQDCASVPDGARTGEISAAMLADTGCTYVILGHSERRMNLDECDADIREKALQAHQNGLNAIICVGETQSQRDKGEASDVVGAQLQGSLPEGAAAHNTVIAYEPVWAIGTGRSATLEDIGTMHAFIREKLNEILEQGEDLRILYGGSVKPDNAGDIFSVANVDGALVGGASLKAESFYAIIEAAKPV